MQSETDGQSTLEVYKGATQLQKYTYPLSSAATSFTINNVALNSGETISFVGRIVGGAAARVDKIVLTPVATTARRRLRPAPGHSSDDPCSFERLRQSRRAVTRDSAAIPPEAPESRSIG